MGTTLKHDRHVHFCVPNSGLNVVFLLALTCKQDQRCEKT